MKFMIMTRGGVRVYVDWYHFGKGDLRLYHVGFNEGGEGLAYIHIPPPLFSVKRMAYCLW